MSENLRNRLWFRHYGRRSLILTLRFVDHKTGRTLRQEMEQSPTDRPVRNTIRFAESAQTEDDGLATSLANVVICDCAVTSFSLISPLSIRVEAGWSTIYVVRFGDCWLNGDGLSGPIRLRAGDTVLLPRGRPHWLSTSMLPEPSLDSPTLWDGTSSQPLPVLPSTQAASIHGQVLACRFRNHVGRISALLMALPATVHIPAIEGRPSSLFDATLALIDEEVRTLDPGSRQIVAHLVQILLMQVLRHLLSVEQLAVSMHASAYKDPIIGLSLGLIDSHLRTPWTLASLAEAVGVSRSTFAARFVEKVGTPPLAYLWQRRMENAVAMLSGNEFGIKEIAARIGYKSESAFSTAFKRWSGMTPGAFRRTRQI